MLCKHRTQTRTNFIDFSLNLFQSNSSRGRSSRRTITEMFDSQMQLATSIRISVRIPSWAVLLVLRLIQFILIDCSAIDLIAEIPPKEVTERVVYCNGGDDHLGHPKVYINLVCIWRALDSQWLQWNRHLSYILVYSRISLEHIHATIADCVSSRKRNIIKYLHEISSSTPLRLFVSPTKALVI